MINIWFIWLMKLVMVIGINSNNQLEKNLCLNLTMHSNVKVKMNLKIELFLLLKYLTRKRKIIQWGGVSWKIHALKNQRCFKSLKRRKLKMKMKKFKMDLNLSRKLKCDNFLYIYIYLIYTYNIKININEFLGA